jgi:NO-binding membrane sensor protein with MHYT domain
VIVAQAVHRHASQDLLFVVVSVGLALVGSFAALVSAIRIPLSAGRARARWTLAAAVSLGGGAIWSMHFIGMIGYRVDGLDLRYDLPMTGLSLVIAIAASALGLSLVARRPRSIGWLAVSGVVAGLGIAAMHYTGMAAMHVGGTVTYRSSIVVLSIVIAVAAALAALWIAFRVRTSRHVVLASLVMAAAVCGMHYTAMTATQVQAGPGDQQPPGTDPISLAPIVCVIAFTLLALVIFSALGGVAEVGALTLAYDARSRHRRVGPEDDSSRPSSPVPTQTPPFAAFRVAGDRQAVGDRYAAGDRQAVGDRPVLGDWHAAGERDGGERPDGGGWPSRGDRSAAGGGSAPDVGAAVGEGYASGERRSGEAWPADGSRYGVDNPFTGDGPYSTDGRTATGAPYAAERRSTGDDPQATPYLA